jgi:hypothetical protein
MKSCEHCCDPIDTGEWYPVTAPDDRNRILSFCSQDCLDDWTELDRAADDDRNRPIGDGFSTDRRSPGDE